MHLRNLDKPGEIMNGILIEEGCLYKRPNSNMAMLIIKTELHQDSIRLWLQNITANGVPLGLTVTNKPHSELSTWEKIENFKILF